MNTKVFKGTAAKKRNSFFFSAALFLLTIILLSGATPVFTEQLDGRAYLKKGKLELDTGRLDDAVQSLLIARREFPLLGDYASIFLSDAYHRLGDHVRALDAATFLIHTYPGSPLLKKARSAEIRESKECDDGQALKLYEAYTKDYPDDDTISMDFGLYLKQHGDTTKASAVFKTLYIKGCSFAGPALAELNPGDITVADLIARSTNLMKRYEFSQAAKDLRKALQTDDGGRKDEILRNLGQTLFRQKEYKEAAVIYDRAHDLYSKARSLYRAGDKQGFDKALHVLLDKNDQKAGELLNAAAGDRRRAGDYREAAKLYSDVLAKFPAEEEEALWGSGWTWFLSAEYRKAADVFARLSAKYDDPKYRYWQARSIEALGEDASGIYRQISRIDNNFYGFMAQVKIQAEGKIIPVSQRETALNAPAGEQWKNRIEALVELEMHKEAVYELTCAAKKIESQSGLLYILSKFHELGEYRKAVGIATKMPYTEKLHRYWYPMAYWDEVSGAARKYDLDPMVALSVMREESHFDADALSVAGARGLMQIMPQTAYRLDRTAKLGIQKDSQIHDVRTNINLGVFYLKSLSGEFRTIAHALAAYNAGEAAVRKWEKDGSYKNIDEFIEDIPYGETQNYVKKVLTSYFQYRKTAPVESDDLMLAKP